MGELTQLWGKTLNVLLSFQSKGKLLMLFLPARYRKQHIYHINSFIPLIRACVNNKGITSITIATM